MANEATPRLRLIKGPPKQLLLDFVTDADLAEVVGWQDMQWKANLEAARKIESIESRIKNGAQIVARNFYFDHKRHLVRTKKSPAASGE
jgi:hypothetical protein